MDAIETLTLPQRVVLLGVAALERESETPAPVNVITRRTREYAEEVADLGKLTEARVDGALNELEAGDAVAVPTMDDTSPVGKGRPSYELVGDADDVLAALGEDDRLAHLTEEAGAA